MISKDGDKSLIDYLKQIPDRRKAGGRRHPLWLILKSHDSRHIDVVIGDTEI